MSKTNPARGMRDFLPADVRKREYVIGIIKEVYESYGFEPLETPAVENLETLMGKYGEEGNQLIFKILKRGEKLVQSAGFSPSERDESRTLNELSDLALRYDLTVPLARVVAHHRNDLPKFFKRYQIQPVWRADRPARGRFREFYQCDVDAIGSTSVVVETELISAVCTVLTRLGFKRADFKVLLNHRKFLFDSLVLSGIEEKYHLDALVAMDKLEKIGPDSVRMEMLSRGIPENAAESFREFIHELATAQLASADLAPSAVNIKALNIARNRFEQTGTSQDSLDTVERLLDLSQSGSAKEMVLFAPALARGLSYYTGSIMEIYSYLPKGAEDVEEFKGSLGGGGRYDGLIGMFGKEQIPACGFSLGLERILVVMEERGMFPPEIAESAPADVMVTIWSEETVAESLKLASELRSAGLRVTVYPEPDKLGKQMKYADQINVPYVCVLGETEIAEGKVTLKNMKTGNQDTLDREAASTIADHINKGV